MSDLHDNIISALTDCAKELQLTPRQVQSLNALSKFKSYEDSGRRLGISGQAFHKRLASAHNWIRSAIRMLADAQPVDEKRKKIDWSKFGNHARVSLVSMSMGLQYWKDIELVAYQLPHLRGVSKVTYDEIRLVVEENSGLKMPDWDNVTRRS